MTSERDRESELGDTRPLRQRDLRRAREHFNAGVLFRILDDAGEQECREVILAYGLLRRRAGDNGWTKEELDATAEDFLHDALGFAVDFEVEDALQKLVRLRCASVDDAGRWRAAPVDQAFTSLEDLPRVATVIEKATSNDRGELPANRTLACEV